MHAVTPDLQMSVEYARRSEGCCHVCWLRLRSGRSRPDGNLVERLVFEKGGRPIDLCMSASLPAEFIGICR